MNKNSLRLAAWGAVLLLFWGCAPKYNITAAYDEEKPYRVALLPVANETNDLDGPPIFRKYANIYLVAKGYDVPDLVDVDRVLAEEFDVQEGGQLNAVDPVELGKVLKCDALVYVTITEWVKHTLGVYTDMIVAGKFEMLSTKDGAVLWQVPDQRYTKRKIADPYSAAMVTVQYLLKNYEPTVDHVVNGAFKTLPSLEEHKRLLRQPKQKG
ncbi:MAG: GNA1162 family protein [Bdellovibrionota bacterium]